MKKSKRIIAQENRVIKACIKWIKDHNLTMLTNNPSSVPTDFRNAGEVFNEAWHLNNMLSKKTN